MATRYIQQPLIPASHVFISPIPTKMMKIDAAAATLLPATHLNKPIITRLRESPSSNISSYRRITSHPFVKAAANDEVLTEQETLARIKQDLFAALEGINRGIFGVTSAKKTEIENLVELLESQNPTPQPTLCLEKVGGSWKLIYSTITILGSKRTKLGLRDFISLDDFLQSINVSQGKAVNVIKFSAKGLNLLSGQLTIDCSFKIASKSRVDIIYNKSVITPDQLMNVFRKNYHLLLQIFNPDGWLEITYVDDSLRIGRDDKGNMFILERVEDGNKP